MTVSNQARRYAVVLVPGLLVAFLVGVLAQTIRAGEQHNQELADEASDFQSRTTLSFDQPTTPGALVSGLVFKYPGKVASKSIELKDATNPEPSTIRT